MCENVIDGKLPGSLSQLNMDQKTRETLLDYLSNSMPRMYSDFLWSLVGDKNFLMMLDVLEGLTIKIPSRQVITRIMSNIAIYNYLEARGCTDESISKAALIFKKREPMIRRIYEDVEGVLKGTYDIQEDEEDVES